MQQLRLGLLVRLFGLYASQGLAFGFQSKALPLVLRAAGLSYRDITGLQLLHLPWQFKWAVAPFIDREAERSPASADSNRIRRLFAFLGPRVSILFPIQMLLAAGIFLAAPLLRAFRADNEKEKADSSVELGRLMVALVLVNSLSALQDIVVDALAVDLLRPTELGWGNTAQVAGFKIGMILGGGVLISLSEVIGWVDSFRVMAASVFFVALSLLSFREADYAAENKKAESNSLGEGSGREDSENEQEKLNQKSLSDIARVLWGWAKKPSARWLMLLVFTYKAGESMGDSVTKPFLIDKGFTVSELGWWTGIYGMSASTLGSFLGGAVVVRWPLERVLWYTSILRLLSQIYRCFLAYLDPPTSLHVIGAIIAENVSGGALTTAMFAFMMQQVDRSIGATHFTFLATLELTGKSVTGISSGFVADLFSPALVLKISVLLSLMYLPLVWRFAYGTESRSGSHARQHEKKES